jgi:hypothetical protein
MLCSPALIMQGYFYFWVILALVWALVASVLAAALPLVESQEVFASVAKGLLPCLGFLKKHSAKKAATDAEHADVSNPREPLDDAPGLSGVVAQGG